MRHTRLVHLGFALVLGACAGHSGDPASGSEAGPARNPELATSEEIQAAAATGVADAYQFVMQRHYNWTRPQGTSFGVSVPQVTVWMDGQRLGDLTTLRQVLLTGLESIRHLNGAEAQGQLGLQASGGAIIVSHVR